MQPEIVNRIRNGHRVVKQTLLWELQQNEALGLQKTKYKYCLLKALETYASIV